MSEAEREMTLREWVEALERIAVPIDDHEDMEEAHGRQWIADAADAQLLNSSNVLYADAGSLVKGFIVGATYEREQTEALQTQADALESALEDAFESIHSEYCGRTHHPVCDLPRNALAAYLKLKERALAAYRKFKGGAE